MKKSIGNKLAQTFAAVILTAAFSGCQAGKTPHPFTTMFDQHPPEYGISRAVHRANIPDTLGENEMQTAFYESAEVH